MTESKSLFFRSVASGDPSKSRWSRPDKEPVRLSKSEMIKER